MKAYWKERARRGLPLALALAAAFAFAACDHEGDGGEDDPIQLEYGTWASGKFTSGGSDDVLWYKFTANASTQYIHISGTDISGYYYVYVYDKNVPVDYGFTYGNSWVKFTLTSGKEYKVKVYSSYGTGTFGIAFNDSSTAPSH